MARKFRKAHYFKAGATMSLCNQVSREDTQALDEFTGDSCFTEGKCGTCLRLKDHKDET
jgi:hypothetical protein